MFHPSAFYLTPVLIRPAGHLDQMIPELGLDRANNLADFGTENHLIEFLNHNPPQAGYRIETYVRA